MSDGVSISVVQVSEFTQFAHRYLNQIRDGGQVVIQDGHSGEFIAHMMMPGAVPEDLDELQTEVRQGQHRMLSAAARRRTTRETI